MYNYQNQFQALVGTGDAGMMNPGSGGWYPGGLNNQYFGNAGVPRPGDGGYPGGGGCTTGPFYPPGCSPCGPSPAAMAAQQEQYDAWCRQQQAMTAAAARVAIMKELPTVAAPANSVATVAAGANETITVTAPVPLCIIDWDVSRVSASFFTAVSLVSALVPYLVTAGEMQLDVFASDAIHPTTNFPQLIPGTPMVLIVHNISAEAHQFFSVFHGIRGPGQGPCLGYNQGLYGGAY